MKEEMIKPEKKISSHMVSFKEKIMNASPRKRLVVLVVAVIVVIGLGFLVYGYFSVGSKALTPQNKLQKQFLDQLPKLQSDISKDPNNSGLQQQLGVAKYATGDLQGAQAAYQKTVQLDPNNAVAHNNLANTYRDLGNYVQAEAEYRLAMKADPKLTTPYMNLASIYQYILGKPNVALTIYASGIVSNPDYVDFYNATGSIYEAQGLKDKAIASYQKALTKQAGNPAAEAGLKRLGK
jgi:tetratricopeptide (TPR) repeat protein